MPASAVADLRNTFGAVVIALAITLVLYGVTISQTWSYYWQYRSRDPMALKGFVAILLILDTVHTFLCGHSVYWYLIQNFGNVQTLDISTWSINAQVFIIGFIGYLVQLFYARQVYIISKGVVFPVAIAILGGIACTMSLRYTIKSFALQEFTRFGTLEWNTSLGLTTGAVADIIIALTMCWYLYRQKSGIVKSDSVISTMMTYSICTGLLTSIFATGAFISFKVAPADAFTSVFVWLMGKCYVNSCLAMLNNRDNLRARTCEINSTIPFRIDSVQQDHHSKTDSTPVSSTVQQTATSSFATSKHTYDNQELEKSERMTISYTHYGPPELTV